MQKRPTSAYIHIPFCTQICYYCDFSKVFIKNQPVDTYLERLIAEVCHYDLPALKTLYIGGGTPSALSAQQLDYLLTNLEKTLDLTQLEEFTIEANPGDLTADKIAVLKNSACNRISLGVQTFDNKMRFLWVCKLLTTRCSSVSVVATMKLKFMKPLRASSKLDFTISPSI